jgi:hypothetical protein
VEPPALPVRKRFHIGGIEAAIGLAAAASVACFIAFSGGIGHNANHAGDTAAAGIGGDARAVETTLVVPGLQDAVIAQLAKKAGMDQSGTGVYEGDRRAAGRFLVELKGAAAEHGASISGFLPDADRLRITVKP